MSNSTLIKKGYCQCGCGIKAPLADRNSIRLNWIKGNPIRFISGHNSRNGFKANENHHHWKGDSASIRTIHQWIERHYGSPKKCQDCGTTTAKQYDWANISGKYHRDVKDFKRLCRKCHRKFDNYYGENHSRAKLTEKDVIKIRNLYKPREYTAIQLAKQFYVSKRTIKSILYRKTWKHLS